MSEAAAQNNYRVQPGWRPALFGFVVYTIIAIGTIASSGIGYDEFTESSENMLRGPVLALAFGAVFLAIYVWYLRWDWIWRDPRKLSMDKLLWTLPVVMIVGIVARFASVKWGELDWNLALTFLLAGVLVGFTEETLFRGIWLRSMRVNGRSEGRAAAYTTIAFGLFHLPNILVGGGVATFAQIFFAAATGFGLYLFRRGWGSIFAAMIVHGVWDISTFITQDGRAADEGVAFVVATLTFFGGIALALVAIIHVWRKDENTRWQREGAGFDPDAPLTY